MKRTLAMLLAVVMLVGMLPTLALAAGTPTITLTTDAAAAPEIGDKFSVTATLSDNPGFASITLSLLWNDKAVRFNGFQEIDDDGDILLDSFLSSYAPVYNQEKGIVTAARATNSTKNGKLFVANFEVIGTGSFDIALMKNFPDFTYADEDGTDLTATFDETAVSALCVAVPATAVSLAKDSLSMVPGATYNLIPRVTPGDSTDKLVCTSSDENVATVDANGVVTAVDAGTAIVTDKAVAATCTKTGLTEGKHCSVCNTVLAKQEVVPVKEHTVVTDKAVDATYTKTGKTEGKHCSVCGKVLTAQKTVAMQKLAKAKITSITNTKDGITVKWGKVTGATAYQVYRKVGTGSWKLIKTTTSTSMDILINSYSLMKLLLLVVVAAGAGSSLRSAMPRMSSGLIQGLP